MVSGELITSEYLLALPPGRELDAIAAESIGWRWILRPNHEGQYLRWLAPPEHDPVSGLSELFSDGTEPLYNDALRYVPYFSTSIADADTLIDALTSQHLIVRVNSECKTADPNDSVQVEVLYEPAPSFWRDLIEPVRTDSRPHAITLAACLAVLALKEN